MAILITCCIVLAIAYARLMYLYRKGWDEQPFYELPEKFRPDTPISVIIPARNEAANIEACLQSVLKQDYPKELMEIIVVDDQSADNTAAIAQQMDEARVKVIRLSRQDGNAFKKKALAAGIFESSGLLVATTDADCIVPPQWLKLLAAAYEAENESHSAAMAIGPVAYHTSAKLVEIFQSLDFMMMQGITVAAYRRGMGDMANGANLAFSRVAYENVGGYEGFTHLASGDDYHLLYKIKKKFPGRICYVKSQAAIVRTSPQPSWSAFLQQRVRWASKSGKYADHKLTTILVLVYLFNVSILALAIVGFWHPLLWLMLLAVLLVKVTAELFLLRPVARFFQKEHELRLFPLLQPLHIIYIVIAGFLGMKGSYTWKGRKVK
jgi:cellulose synthase/poly-beta-1,6-N-acetylglucosamine synthase-like glycosyltransferase